MTHSRHADATTNMIKIASHSKSLESRVIALILTIQRAEFGFDTRVEDQPDLLDVANF